MSINKNIFYSVLTQIPGILLGFISGILITRILGPAGRGVFSIFQSDIELCALFFGFSLNSALTYFVANRKIELEKLGGIALLLFACSFLLFSLVLFLIYYFSKNTFLFPLNHDSLFYYLYLDAAFGLTMANSIISGFFYGKSMFKIINFISVVNSIFNVICFGTAFYYFHHHASITVSDILSLSFLVLLINFTLWLYFF